MSIGQQLLSLISFTMMMLVVASIIPILGQVVTSEATLPATVLHLERIASFSNQSIDMHFIRAYDHLRHSWMSRQSMAGGAGVVVFPLDGLFDPYIFWVNFTRYYLFYSDNKCKDTG